MDTATLNLSIDNAQRNFLYRKGLVDEAAIVHALVNSSYDFGSLSRAAELSNLYWRLSGTGKAPLIVDAGANIGAGAVYFAHKFAKAAVIAIEPDKNDFELLVANTADLPVECLHAALAPSAATFAAEPKATAGRVTISDIYERNVQMALPFIVKIDAEAHGGELFSGNLEWVGRTPIIIVALRDCLIPGTANTRTCVDYITGCNRDFTYLNDSIFSVDRELALRRFDS